MKPVVQNKQQTIRQQGFTLLELMVVLAIIGILATIGASQFQAYIARARVVEGLNLAQPYKLAVAEQITANGGVFTVDQLGLPDFVPTDDVSAISVTDRTTQGGGVITITFAARVGGGGTLTLTPTVTNSAIQWTCRAGRGENQPDPTSGATLRPDVAPANCRG